MAVAVLSVAGLNASGQRSYDKVVLKDSTVLYGRVIEFESDGHLTLITDAKTTYIIDMSRVARVSRVTGPVPLSSKPPFNTKTQRGYFNEWEMGLNMGTSAVPTWWGGTRHVASFSLQVVNGYRFNRYRQLGLGFGIEVFERYPFSPVFLKGGGNLFEGPVSPLYWGEIGYAFGWSADESKGGPMAGLGGGVRFNSRGTASFQVAFGYRIQKATVTIETIDWQGNPILDMRRYMFNRICLRLGVAF